MNVRQRPATSKSLVAVITLLSIPSSVNAQLDRELKNELAIGIGFWIGGDFISRSGQFDDPTVGPVEFGTSASQGNSASIGAGYSHFFNDWFGLGASVAYAAPDWSFLVGRVEDGELVGMTEVLPSVSTFAFSGNGVFRLPSGPNVPSPFVSLGIGGVSYEVERLRGPLTFTPTVGTPVDTVLFDLDFGLNLAPNVAGGVYYALASRLVLRAEARLWLMLIKERVRDETLVQRNVWLNLSAGYVF